MIERRQNTSETARAPGLAEVAGFESNAYQILTSHEIRHGLSQQAVRYSRGYGKGWFSGAAFACGRASTTPGWVAAAELPR